MMRKRKPQHEHWWGPPAYEYTPPLKRSELSYSVRTYGPQDRFDQWMTFGFTTWSARCTICGVVESRIEIGKVSAR